MTPARPLSNPFKASSQFVISRAISSEALQAKGKLSGADATKPGLESGRAGVTDPGYSPLRVNDLGAGSDKGRIEQGTSDATLFLDNQTLRGFGWVGWDPRSLNVVNNGLINADVNDRFLGFWVNSLLNSPGKVMEGTNGGNLHLDFITLTNTGASIVAETNSRVTATSPTRRNVPRSWRRPIGRR